MPPNCPGLSSFGAHQRTAQAPPPAERAPRGVRRPAFGRPAWRTAAPRRWRSSRRSGPAAGEEVVGEGRRRAGGWAGEVNALCRRLGAKVEKRGRMPRRSVSLLRHSCAPQHPQSLTLRTKKERWKKPTAVMAKKQRWCSSRSQFLHAVWGGATTPAALVQQFPSECLLFVLDACKAWSLTGYLAQPHMQNH